MHAKKWIWGITLVGLLLGGVLAWATYPWRSLNPDFMFHFFRLSEKYSLTHAEKESAIRIVRETLKNRLQPDTPSDPPPGVPDKFTERDPRQVWVTLYLPLLPSARGMATESNLFRSLRQATRQAMQKAKRFGFDTYAVATVQEEVGCRGAGVSAYGVEPDLGIALDVTVAADIPGAPDHEQVTRLGQGVGIKLLDSASISHPGLFQHMKALAVKRKIDHQVEILPRGGTDSGPCSVSVLACR